MSKAAELAKSGDTLTNQPSGRKNIVINGGMQISQRSVSTTGVGNASGYFGPDRWKIHKDATTAGRLTMTQSTDAPDGFANSLKMDCTTADTSIAAGERLNLGCSIEGFDCQHIKKGTSDALPMTLSFYVKGDQAATYNVEVGDFDNNRCFYKRFAVTTSWNKITIAIPADTTGAFNNDNGESIALGFWLNAGATYNGGTFVEDAWSTYAANVRSHSSNTQFFDSTDREFFITGIQLEVGSQATNFEHRSRGEELALCQRYYQKLGGSYGAYDGMFSGNVTGTDLLFVTTNSKVTMRSSPTFTLGGGVANHRYSQGGSDIQPDAIVADQVKPNSLTLKVTHTGQVTSGNAARLFNSTTTGYYDFDAEL